MPIVRHAQHNTLTLDHYNNLIKPNHILILVGDFNCHNTLWGSPKTDTQGDILENFLNNNNLVCRNDGSITYIADNNTGTSAIDLTLSSANIGVNDQWETMDTLNSDHLPILTTYKSNINFSEKRNLYSKSLIF